MGYKDQINNKTKKSQCYQNHIYLDFNVFTIIIGSLNNKKVIYKSILKFFILDIFKMSIFDFIGGLFLRLFEKAVCEHNAVK